MSGNKDSQRGASVSVEREHHSRTSSRSGGVTGLRRLEGKSGDKKNVLEGNEQDPNSSRSISPANRAPNESDFSRSPASPSSPTFTSLPQYSPSPDSTTKHGREPSKSFFQNLKASKSSAKIQPPDGTIRRVPTDNRPEGSPRSLVKTTSTPDLRNTSPSEPIPGVPRLDRDEGSQQSVASSVSSHTIPRRPVGAATGSGRSITAYGDIVPSSTNSDQNEPRKNGKLFPSFMKRSHGARSDEGGTLPRLAPSVLPKNSDSSTRAPTRDRSTSRQKEEDTLSSHSHERKASRTQLRDQRSQSFRDGVGSKLFTGFKTHTSKAAKDLGKAGKEWFKGRQAAPAQAPPDYMSYQVKVINLPLVEQTRLTRIAKKLEDSKDKTEFWMPALPWRCIDFLNFTGCETEGLYRVPGSEREVKMWKARFDQEHDINLFEEEELFDINAIGSLFKNWLRELPDDVFPQELQERLSAKYSGQLKAPEEVKEVLSDLPPWNYYLLFAITCHLSLLNAYQEKNKMSLQNLFICFSNSLRLNADCFRWLVGDWRSCWKGCITEKGALEAEYRLIENYPETFDSEDSFDEAKSIEGQSNSHRDNQTPKADVFLSSKPQSPLQSPPRRPERKESPPQAPLSASLPGPKASAHSRASSQNVATRKEAGRELPTSDNPSRGKDELSQRGEEVVISSPRTPKRHSTGVHGRTASQLPEFDFGKPISPTFATTKRDSAAFKHN